MCLSGASSAIFVIGSTKYGEPRFTPIYHKLVVVKDSRSGVMSSYLRFYVPDPDYAAGRTADDYDRLLNSGSKGDFTGLAVYTSLDGFPVHAVRYAGEHARLKRSLR